jgi:hypothetical protein
MARSSYIYVVRAPMRIGVVATFTVKHEMITWIRREWDRSQREGHEWVKLGIWRFPDGPPDAGGSVYVGSAEEVAGLA